MLIKKRILISNVLMIIIPVILIMIVSGILRLSYTKTYEIPKGPWGYGEKNPIVAQSLIAEFSNRMQYSQTINGLDELQSELQNQLLEDGIYSAITRDNEIVASNFTNEVKKLAADMGGENISMPKSFTVQSGSVLLIRDSFQKDSNIFTVTAINPNYMMNLIDLETRMTAMGTYATIIFVLAIIIIVVTNGVISAKTSKKIIVPLDLLSYGAEQIKNGNLDFEIKYDSKDEFGTAISNFDEMRARLHQSIQAQLKYEEDRKELVAGISHDLRTPLTAIKGYVKGLKDGVANTPEKQQRYRDIIYSKACEMDVLVDTLFLFSKLDTGHLPFYFEKVNCKQYLDEFINQITEDFERNGLKIAYHNSCSPDTVVKIDSDQMNRVFINILENSAKYKPLDICHVDFEASRKGEEIVLEIRDDGQGVPEEILPNLFNSFYRGDASRTNPTESSGLGLSIAERIVKAHNGTITAQNKNGLAIIIKLPVAEEE
ncbi:HAMP domain-containing sensor histidine kinase [Desulfosporosinus sp. OT]|uniref:sensor histidine kinase n=1 Tax=Desulfosporosinus sp. OT TaxID=913865 RepID=UPI0002239EF3|nr:HAMP domain-containing sensor histidine kinase [Desulfosporosinus sp. OT]EGW36624.1 HAMP domain protein [Desulfosporosinus sp. OT]